MANTDYDVTNTIDAADLFSDPVTVEKGAKLDIQLEFNATADMTMTIQRSFTGKTGTWLFVSEHTSSFAGEETIDRAAHFRAGCKAGDYVAGECVAYLQKPLAF